MKTKYPSLFGLLVALMLVASFVVPSNFLSPKAAEADPGICKWDTLITPGYMPGKGDIANGSEILDMVVGGDGATVLIIARSLISCLFAQELGGPIGAWCASSLTPFAGCTANLLYYSNNNGISFTSTKTLNLLREWVRIFGAGSWNGHLLYLVAIAPDNPNVWAVVSDNPDGVAGSGPQEVWITTNAGGKWECTNLRDQLNAEGEFIRWIDISIDYGGKRDIAVGTVDGNGGGDVYVVKSTGFTGWIKQGFDAIPLGDFFAGRFSPTYNGDGSLALVFADGTATYYNISLRDIDSNTHDSFVFTLPGIEVKDQTWTAGTSPEYGTLNKADLELPSDFSGQAASLRRAYISLDAMDGPSCEPSKKDNARDGIFRIDDSTVYTLMDTHTVLDKSIYSIAYYGTYASGKLLAGERLGYPCDASVPTWFTDSPTTCPIPCWYPCLKCPTGAACQCVVDTTCATAKVGNGGAIVGWRADGQLAFAGTGSRPATSTEKWWIPWTLPVIANDESAFSISRNNGETWNQTAFIDTTISYFSDIAPSPDCKTIYLASINECATVGKCTAIVLLYWDGENCNAMLKASENLCTCGPGTAKLAASCEYDPTKCELRYNFKVEFTSHCACSTCNTCEITSIGEISGRITNPKISSGPQDPSYILPIVTPCDCTDQPGCGVAPSCCCFDSVWRTSSNAEVVAPYPPLPVGIFWERVLTKVTAPNCNEPQTEHALLRLVPYCADPTGQIVAWGVYDPDSWFRRGVAMWSPDYGDYWANINVRNPIQDFTFESKTVMYFLSPGGLVQKMPYTGTTWATTMSDIDTVLLGAHTIAAYPEGKVLVGAAANYLLYAVAYSSNLNTDNPSFTLLSLAGATPHVGNTHVAFDPNFKDNNLIFIADENGEAGGSVYRNNPAAQLRWVDTNMMDPNNGAVGCPGTAERGFFGLVISNTGEALYAAGYGPGRGTEPFGVWRTLDLHEGMPKPGIAWDYLYVGLEKQTPQNVFFTLEPSSLKACGCCTMDTDTTLYAIDNNYYFPRSITISGICCIPGYPCPLNKYQGGLVWAFTDCMAKKGPKLVTADKTLIGCDPVSGRAAEVNLCWEQLCVADEYDLEIAKDANFTLKIIDIAGDDECGGLYPADVMKPCAFFPAGGAAQQVTAIRGGGVVTPTGSALAAFGNLECGHTFYWRVKVKRCATGQYIMSPWSEVRSFSVKAGVPIVGSSVGLQLLSPANGALGVPVNKPSFSWSPLGEVGKYKFVLAKDAALTQVVKEAEVSGSTAYTYDGKLDYDTNYFWQVRGLEPATDPSAVFSFRTEQAPPPPPEPEKPVPTPLWVWVLIAIGAILVIVTLVLIFKTRRV